MNYPIERNGFIYNKGTARGFLRMQRQGIPRPLFSIENKLAKILKARYKKLAQELLKDLKAKCAQNNIVMDAAPDDSIEGLITFFKQLARQSAEKQQDIADRANMLSIADTLKKEWLGDVNESVVNMYLGEIDESIKPVLDRVFKQEQADYLKRLISDADARTKHIIQGFSIDKQKFFEDNMTAVRTLYIDNSLERIAGEQDYIKRQILKRITSYAMNESPTLELDDLTKLAYDAGDHMARLFARDQMQRFNKACTLSTFHSAGVTKVKWVTANDGRVRNKGYIDNNGVYHRAHTELQGQIFDVNDLPIEINDYNCRCGLVPVEWADD